MASKKMKQMRITGATGAGVRVFCAVDVPADLKTDTRCSRYLTEKARALAAFAKKHPGARVLEIRLMSFKESDHAW